MNCHMYQNLTISPYSNLRNSEGSSRGASAAKILPTFAGPNKDIHIRNSDSIGGRWNDGSIGTLAGLRGLLSASGTGIGGGI